MKKFFLVSLLFCLATISYALSQNCDSSGHYRNYTLRNSLPTTAVEYLKCPNKQTVIPAIYDSISWNENLNVFLAYNNDELRVFDKNGNILNSSLVDTLLLQNDTTFSYKPASGTLTEKDVIAKKLQQHKIIFAICILTLFCMILFVRKR